MEESRGGKYGRFLGNLTNIIIDSVIPDSEKESYKTCLINEIKSYSFEPRKSGTPKSSGCVWELIDMDSFDISNPKTFGKTIKEGIHLMYQKQTQKRVLDALLNELSQP
ncbi:MAG: hypothetical protein Q7R52_04815 [archaeon]|nr:hypothetical protein [archaeon]